MSISFRKAVREQTSILIALAGSSGSGKTFSSLRLARGLAGPDGKIAAIDTEAGRMLHYADRFDFDHADLRAPFTPDAYLGAITTAVSLNYRVIVIDSWSHVWAGEGGVTDQHAEALHNMVERAKKRNPGADEYALHDTLNGPAWRCKIPYKVMVQRLLQCRSHIVFCLRAEPKVRFIKDPKTNKTSIVDAGWQPICEKLFPYEMTVSFMLSDDAPGIGTPKKLQEQHKPCFPTGALLDEKAGELLAAWASGGAKRNDGATAGTGPVAPTGLGTEGREPAAAIVIPDPDEMTMRPVILRAIEHERAKIRPSAAGWATVVAYFCIVDDPAKVTDVAALDDLLAFLRALARGEPAAKQTLDEKILQRTAAGARH